MQANIARIENRLFVVSALVDAPVYDFDFDLHFACDHPYRIDQSHPCVFRLGAIRDYEAEHRRWSGLGLVSVNSPQDHRTASEFEHWYPLIRDLTPESRIFDALPDAADIAEEFGWPVFVKGSCQTAKHDPELSIARDVESYLRLRERYGRNPILHWQRPVVRKLVPLDRISGSVPGKIAPSREFRTFWWRGTLVGHGCYCHQLPRYGADDLDAGLALAAEATRRVNVPFLVVDIARRRDGGWIVIECNDAQESGYAGVPPRALWRNILDLA